MDTNSHNYTDIIISFFLGIVVVAIFIKLFEPQCIVIKGYLVDKLSQTIIKRHNICQELNLNKIKYKC